LILNKMKAGLIPGHFGEMMAEAINHVAHEGKQVVQPLSNAQEFNELDLEDIHAREPKVLPAFLQIFLLDYLPTKEINLSEGLVPIKGQIKKVFLRVGKENFSNLNLNGIRVLPHREQHLIDKIRDEILFILAHFTVLKIESRRVGVVRVDEEFIQDLADMVPFRRANAIETFAMRELAYHTLQEAGVGYDEVQELLLNSQDPLVESKIRWYFIVAGMNPDTARRVALELSASQQEGFLENIKQYSAESKRVSSTIWEFDNDFKLIMSLYSNALSSDPKNYIGVEWNGELPQKFKDYLYFLDERSRNSNDPEIKALTLNELHRLTVKVSKDDESYFKYKLFIEQLLGHIQLIPFSKEEMLFRLLRTIREKDTWEYSLLGLMHTFGSELFAEIQSLFQKFGHLFEGEGSEGGQPPLAGLFFALWLGPLASSAWGSGLRMDLSPWFNLYNLVWVVVPIIVAKPLRSSLGIIKRVVVHFPVDSWVVPISFALVKPIEFVQRFFSKKNRIPSFAAPFSNSPTIIEGDVASTIRAVEKYTGESYNNFSQLNKVEPSSQDINYSHAEVSLELEQSIGKESSVVSKGAILLVDLNDFVKLETKAGDKEVSVNYIPAVTEVISTVKRTLRANKEATLALVWESGIQNSSEHAKLDRELLERLGVDKEKTTLLRSPAEILPYIQDGREVKVFTLNGSRWALFINKVQLVVLESLRQRIQIQEQTSDWLKFRRLFSVSM